MQPSIDRGPRAGAVVVLGKKPPGNAAIHPDFAANLQAAADLTQEGSNRLLVISGGATRRGRPPEAEVGLEVVRDHVNVPILLELESRTTTENIRNVRRMLEPRGIQMVTFVTSAYHIRRTRLLVDRLWPAVSDTARYAHGAGTDRWPERLVNGLYLPYAAVDPGNQTLVRITRRLFRNG